MAIADFFIDKFPVTNEAYHGFVLATGYKPNVSQGPARRCLLLMSWLVISSVVGTHSLQILCNRTLTTF